jgi:hypothetical protein
MPWASSNHILCFVNFSLCDKCWQCRTHFCVPPGGRFRTRFPSTASHMFLVFPIFFLRRFKLSLFQNNVCPVWIMKHRIIYCPEVLISVFISWVSSRRHYCLKTAVYGFPSKEHNTCRSTQNKWQPTCYRVLVYDALYVNVYIIEKHYTTSTLKWR